MKGEIGAAISEYVDANLEDAIALLEQTVNIESPTENLSGVKQVGMAFRNEFDSLGFSTNWIEMPAEMNRAGHLTAEKKGGTGKRILLIGHLDTVLSGEKFRLAENEMFGSGVLDMKAGNVILYYALKTLHALGALENASINVILTGDEENGGKPTQISRRELLAFAERSDFALCFENGEKNLATVARRGFNEWRVEITAKTGHSSQIFRENIGAGAIFEAVRIVNRFYEFSNSEEYLTINPAVIAGGAEVEVGEREATAVGKSNVVPAKVFLRGDFRFISPEQKEKTRAKMREIAADNLPGTTAHITFKDGIPAMPPTDENHALLEHLSAVSQELDFGKIEAQNPGERGAGDISHVAHLLPCLDGLGAMGGKAHARGEYVDLETFPEQIKRAALLIYRLTRL